VGWSWHRYVSAFAGLQFWSHEAGNIWLSHSIRVDRSKALYGLFLERDQSTIAPPYVGIEKKGNLAARSQPVDLFDRDRLAMASEITHRLKP